jgi:transcriptional regulator with GAF, ATPase, and Fis domain
MRTEEVADGSRLAAATRYEWLVGVSNVIGTHRDPKELFSALARELHRVVTFHYVGVFIHDKTSNTFHDHFVDAETEAVVPRDPDLVMEDTDAWWVYHSQQPRVTLLEAGHAPSGKFQELLKKYGVLSVCTLPLTTAHSKIGTLTFASKAPGVYTRKFGFFPWWLADRSGIRQCAAL